MDKNNKNNWRSSKEKRKDNVDFDKSSSMGEKSQKNKSSRGTRAGKKVQNFRNEKQCLNLLLKNLGVQCSENYTQKMRDQRKSSQKPCENSSHTNRIEQLQSSTGVEAKGWPYRGKRAGRQIGIKNECKKLVTFLSALAQECARH